MNRAHPPSVAVPSALALPNPADDQLGIWSTVAVLSPLVVHRIVEGIVARASGGLWTAAARHTLPASCMLGLSLLLWRTVQASGIWIGTLILRCTRHLGI